ncbi:hypothetical protein N658DRAFT_492159 [Parathielavia hyrcaniae]|uniref:Uncharacterized protein n=1 Tax=Parathielavia hyrcaniae TaxID=113614 RepID=A0AAN6T6B6_9PEZI|nr:hypothetical protein N658DRAFT_492159 [Parathielavia hyrcaniae]
MSAPAHQPGFPSGDQTQAPASSALLNLLGMKTPPPLRRSSGGHRNWRARWASLATWTSKTGLCVGSLAALLGRYLPLAPTDRYLAVSSGRPRWVDRYPAEQGADARGIGGGVPHPITHPAPLRWIVG